MTAAARPAHITDQATEAVARHRAAAEVLAVGYRSALATSDPLAAFAGVAGAAWQSMCSRELSQVLAAAVQVIVEMQDAAGEKASGEEPFVTPCVAAELGVAHPGHVLSERANVHCAGFEQQADRAGVDRHWGPLAATGGEL